MPKPNVFLTPGEAQEVLDLLNEYPNAYPTLKRKMTNVRGLDVSARFAADDERAVRVFDILSGKSTFMRSRTTKVREFILELGSALMDDEDNNGPGFSKRRREFYNNVLKEASDYGVHLPSWAWTRVSV